MAADLDHKSVERAYARWAPIYDLVFDKVMAAGRRAGVAAAGRLGSRILDVGVGTGLELPYFAPTATVVGVDISEPMLRKALDRIRSAELSQIAGLAVMDGARLGFVDGAFDCVIAPYVITVVPDPEATLAEFTRVVRPGGEIVLVNHLSADAGARAAFERWLARQTKHLGWRPEFPWARIADWSAAHGVEIVERRNIAPLNLFTLIRLRKHVNAKPSEAAAA